MKRKLLVEVTIGDVEKKYPNYKFNYENQEDFFLNNIVSGLEHIADEQEYDAGYEQIVTNGMLDCMNSFINVGDKVGFIHKTGYYGKHQTVKAGVVVGISNEGNPLYKIQYKTESGKISSCTRTEEEVISIYDLLEEI